MVAAGVTHKPEIPEDTGTGSSKSGVGKSENKLPAGSSGISDECTDHANTTDSHGLKSDPRHDGSADAQEYQFWLILGVIIIILIAILRRW